MSKASSNSENEDGNLTTYGSTNERAAKVKDIITPKNYLQLLEHMKLLKNLTITIDKWT